MAVWFPFCTRNRSQFHHLSGQGYAAFVDETAELFQVNPALVLRLVGDLLQFQRFDEARQTLMRSELTRMRTMPGLPQFAAGRLDQLLAPR
jgi:aminopeptidase N